MSKVLLRGFLKMVLVPAINLQQSFFCYYVREVLLNIVSKKKRYIHSQTHGTQAFETLHCYANRKICIHKVKSIFSSSLETSSQKHNTIYIMNVIFISFKTPDLPPPLLHQRKTLSSATHHD